MNIWEQHFSRGSKNQLLFLYLKYGHIPPEEIPLGYTEAQVLEFIGAVEQQQQPDPGTYAEVVEEPAAPAPILYDAQLLRARMAAGFIPFNTDVFFTSGAL